MMANIPETTVDTNHHPKGQVLSTRFFESPAATRSDSSPASDSPPSDEPKTASSDGQAADFGQRVQAMYSQAEAKFGQLFAAAKDRIAPLDKWVQTASRDRPYLVAGTAVSVGLLSGAVLRKTAALGAVLTLGLLAANYLGQRGAMASAKPATT
jgi:ElaB/YqjD/DUF883 family membrane-anchored ribosome-binding protein